MYLISSLSSKSISHQPSKLELESVIEQYHRSFISLYVYTTSVTSPFGPAPRPPHQPRASPTQSASRPAPPHMRNAPHRKRQHTRPPCRPESRNEPNPAQSTCNCFGNSLLAATIAAGTTGPLKKPSPLRIRGRGGRARTRGARLWRKGGRGRWRGEWGDEAKDHADLETDGGEARGETGCAWRMARE
jgi:hypothetical protein